MKSLADLTKLYGSVNLINSSSTPDPGEGDWPNGFAYRADIVIPAEQITANISEVIICVPLDLDSNSEASGADLRFETEGGTQLKYYLDRYSGDVAYSVVKIPTLTNNTQTKIHAYVGETTPGTQTDAAGTLNQFVAAWDVDGTDLTGNGYDLTPTGTSTGQLSSGYNCIVYTSGDTVESNDVLIGFDNLAAWTYEATVDRTVDTVLSTLIGGGSEPGFATEYLEFTLRDASASGTTSKPVAVSSRVDGATSTYAVGAANSAANDGEVAYLSTWQFGSAPAIYKNGTAISLIASAAQSANTDIIPASLGIRIGENFQGKLAFPRVSREFTPAAKASIQSKSILSPPQVIGTGAWYGPSDVAAPPVVALPMTGSVQAGNSVDFDVAGDAITTGTATLQSVTQGQRSGSTVTIVSGQARYTPNGTVAGSDFFTATVSDGTNTSVARIDVTISAAAGGGDPNWNVVNVPADKTFTNALSTAAAGDDIVLANGTYTGNFVLNANGTEALPIRIRAENAGSAYINGSIELRGNYNTVRNLRFEGVTKDWAIIDVYGDYAKIQGIRMNNCGVSGSAEKGAILCRPGANYGIIEYCTIENYTQRAICLFSEAPGARFWTIRRNYLRNNIESPQGYSGVAIGIGGEEAPSGWSIDMQCLVEYNLLEEIGGTDGNIIQFKSSGNTARLNTARNCPLGRMEDRRGGWPPTGVFNYWLGNTLINSRGPMCFGPDHIVISNYNDGQVTGNYSSMGPAEGNITWDVNSNQRPRAERQLWSQNEGPMIVGNGFDNLAAIDTIIEEHVGPISYGIHSGTTTRAATVSPITREVLTTDDVGWAQLPD